MYLLNSVHEWRHVIIDGYKLVTACGIISISECIVSFSMFWRVSKSRHASWSMGPRPWCPWCPGVSAPPSVPCTLVAHALLCPETVSRRTPRQTHTLLGRGKWTTNTDDTDTDIATTNTGYHLPANRHTSPSGLLPRLPVVWNFIPVL